MACLLSINFFPRGLAHGFNNFLTLWGNRLINTQPS